MTKSLESCNLTFCLKANLGEYLKMLKFWSLHQTSNPFAILLAKVMCNKGILTEAGQMLKLLSQQFPIDACL